MKKMYNNKQRISNLHVYDYGKNVNITNILGKSRGYPEVLFISPKCPLLNVWKAKEMEMKFDPIWFPK